MTRSPQPELLSSCACGTVRFRAIGKPLTVAVCYCDDCQAGGRQIEALPGASRVLDADGGTPFVTWREDRFVCVAGEDRLTGLKLKDGSPTQRYVATCCNSGMYLKFGPGFWVSTYATRYAGQDLPPLQARIQVKHRQSDAPLPSDVPAYPGTPARIFLKAIPARIAMLFGL